ncbi:hypothetical protein NQ315_007374 [Exocentrus adspersus]|uniref:Ankyrin repeat-containing protein n=1 Tax=Exocentrus adspersus TaxID=1586481 RepID=A0AAV8VI44_9CUCU|nr:hypothetical protein NQ315_007374 [Exocentrus adspersus]
MLRDTPLHSASALGQTESVRLLIRTGADVNLRNRRGLTPLHTCVHHLETCELLLLHGANIDATDRRGLTALHYAAESGDLETVCMLLYYNADANVRCTRGETAFMKALINQKLDIQEALLDYVDDFNILTRYYATSLALALRYNSPFVKDMIERGGNVNYYRLVYEEVPLGKWYKPAFYLSVGTNIENFKLVLDRVRNNEMRCEIDITPLFNLEGDVLQEYIQAIIDTSNIKSIVEYVQRIRSMGLFIVLLSRNGMDEALLLALLSRLLEHGYQANTHDVGYIFEFFGYCDSLKLLWYMDIDYSTGWRFFDSALPRLLFDVDYELNDDNIKTLTIETVDNILPLYTSPTLLPYLLSIYKDESKIKLLESIPKFPSLLQLARDVARKHICHSFNIKKAYQFYNVINAMKIPPLIKRILRYEVKLYWIDASQASSASHVLTPRQETLWSFPSTVPRSLLSLRSARLYLRYTGRRLGSRMFRHGERQGNGMDQGS